MQAPNSKITVSKRSIRIKPLEFIHIYLAVEMHDDGDSTIEYVDMELEQPIEIECTSNISPETMTTTTTTTTSLKATIMPPLAEDEKKLEQPATEEQITGTAAVTTTTILAKTSTLP